MTAKAVSDEKSAPSQKGSNPGRRSTRQREPLLSIDEVAAWLGVEVSFVRYQIVERRIPFVKIGKYVRFDASEIAEWIDGQRVGADRRSPRVREIRNI